MSAQVPKMIRPLSQRELLAELPPPWDASPDELKQATQVVGHPIAYVLNEGWVIADALVPGAAVVAPPPSKERKTADRPQHYRRYLQLNRVLLLIELLAPLTVGATLADVTADIRGEVGDVCQRTVRKDLKVLEVSGLVEKHRPDDGDLR